MYDTGIKRMVPWEKLQRHSVPFLFGYTSLPVMQFTGLRDKNGVEIYEGDLCQSDDMMYEIRWVEYCAKWGAKVIKSHHVLTRGCTFPLQDYTIDRTLHCTFEVIGNIYEHPHLLKEASTNV